MICYDFHANTACPLEHQENVSSRSRFSSKATDASCLVSAILGDARIERAIQEKGQ